MSACSGAGAFAFGSFVRSIALPFIAAILIQSFPIASMASDRKSDPVKPGRISAKVDFGEVRARYFDGRTRITWDTLFESEILGFRVWREALGVRGTINSQIIGGGATKAASGVLAAGDEYSYVDPNGTFDAAYWIEVIFLSGETQLFGPAGVEYGDEKVTASDSPTIDRIALDSVGRRGQRDRVDFRGARAESTVSGDLSESFVGDPAALKFEVRQPGWYRIPAALLQTNGFPLNLQSSWKMFANGVEIPLSVLADGSVEFYGKGVDTIQTDTMVYWLTYGSGTGRRLSRSIQKYSSSAAAGWSRIVAERRDKAIRFPAVVNGPRDNWFAACVCMSEVAASVDLSEIATESNESAVVGVDLQGIGTNPHNVAVLLNGTEIGRIAFNDVTRIEWTTPVPLSALRAGANEIRLRAVGATNDYSALEAVRITYPRRNRAANGRLEFSLAPRKSTKLRGFTSARVRVFDVTNESNVSEINPSSRLEADGTYSVTIGSASSARMFLAISDNVSPLAVSAWVRNQPSDLKNSVNQADFLIISPDTLRPEAEVLRNAREASGLRTMIVDPVDIYDEFGNGVQSAEAIREFFRYAKAKWTVKPDSALLAGDASVDPRNYGGAGGPAANLLPTMFTDTWNGEAVSDALIGDLNGDSIEDITLGRLPVRTGAELAAVIEKILAHDRFSNDQILARGVLMVSDAFVGYDFENGSRAISRAIPPEANTSYVDLANNDPTAVRQIVINSMNSGPSVVNYFGHGSVSFWSNRQIYRTVDAPMLANRTQPSLGIMLACLNGTFAEAADSLAETTIKSPNGGAFGVWASSGWNGAYEEELMGRQFLQRVFAGIPIGEAARQSKSLFQTVDLRSTFIYFGDPTQRLVR